MKRIALRAGAMAGALGLAACGMRGNPMPQTPQSSTQVTPRTVQPMDVVGGPANRLNVLLGDAAPNFGGNTLKKLNLGIREIDAIENGQVTVLATYSRPRIVNVLAHQDDNGESVANANVTRNDYQQLRLVVDLASSSADFTGQSPEPVNFLVNVASASSAGAGSSTVTTSDGPGAVDLLVTQPFSIPATHTQSVRVDFNAFESLALDQSGAVLARASLFVAPYDEMGSIEGRVHDSNGNPVSNATVVAVAPDGSIGNTGWTGSKGHFHIGTLRAGTYTLVIYNNYTTAAGRSVSASGQTNNNPSVAGPTVTVTGGQATSAGILAD